MTDRWHSKLETDLVLEVEGSTLPLYDLGRLEDVIRNRQLLTLFEGREVIKFAEMPQLQHDRCDKAGWSLRFAAIRAGEQMRWGRSHGLVERVFVRGTPEWRIVEREMHFFAVGPAKHQHSIKIRGAGAHPDADRLIKRELRRRERAREKHLAESKAKVSRWLDELRDRFPSTPIPIDLQQHAVPGMTLMIEMRDLLLDLAVDSHDIENAIYRCWVFARQSVDPALRVAPMLRVPDDDLEALGEVDF